MFAIVEYFFIVICIYCYYGDLAVIGDFHWRFLRFIMHTCYVIEKATSRTSFLSTGLLYDDRMCYV